MLAVENPPPDPPCPCEISQLKGSDERASDKLALPEVDLFNSGLDDTQLPKFSIRDYVFGSRSKDINKNWPFSQKHLQLCLKHGLKDVLPPFQSLDSAREGNFRRCTTQTSLPDEENISSLDSLRNLDGDPSRLVPSSSDSARPIAADCIDTNSSGSGREKDFPSSTTCNSQSDIVSDHTHRLSSSAVVETDTLLEASAEVEAAGGLAPNKTESKAQPSAKKCRLIVKLRAVSDPSTTEDIASNCTNLSEAMASKTCPVCKTFSSSSNTTLNAHIDQCLSVESTSRWGEDSRQTRHRIKPRKTRSMVDICATAPRCTLEELDRRNGSSWATDLSLTTQNSEECGHEKRPRVSPIHHPEESGDAGAVYIDASGTKVRILSKLNVPPSGSKVGEDPRTSKPLKSAIKGSKVFTTNKRKRHVNKYHNYLKAAIQSIKDCSPNARNSEIHGTREEKCVADDLEGVEQRGHKFRPQEHIKSNDSGTLRQWVCSKRTGLSKKVNGKDGLQRPSYKLRTAQDLANQSDQLCLGDSFVEKNTGRSPNLLENLISSESNKKVENSLNESQGYDDGERSPGRKRLGSSLFGARISDNVERVQEPLKQNANQSSKENTSVCDGLMLKRTNSVGNHVSPPTNKAADILAGPFSSPDSSTNANPKPCRSRTSLSKPMKFSSLRKDVLPVHKSVLNKKYSTLMKPWVHPEAEMGESPSEENQHDDIIMHDSIENQSEIEEINDSVCIDRSSVPETRQERGAMGVPKGEDAVVLKRSKALWSHGQDIGENIDNSDRVSDDMADKADHLESARKLVRMHAPDIVIDSSKMHADRITTLNKSLGPKFNKLAAPPENKCSSLQPVDELGPLCEDEASHCLTDPSLGDEQGIFCLDEVGNGIIGQNSFLGDDMDSKLGQGNSFPEVEPIPIPGPPGSFLPSPRDMGSEDFQGNSSLTTSRVQSSSHDQHDLVDGDSSDSPISTTSTISNSTVARPDLKCSEQLLYVRAHAVQERIRRSDLSGTSSQPVLENDVTVPEKNSVGGEGIILDGGNLKVKMTASIKGPLNIQDDDQPCCCSRKERISQGVALNYQESQLLRRRSMGSALLPPIGKQPGSNMNTRPNNLNVGPEVISMGNCPSSGSEKVVFPAMKASTDSIPMNGSNDAASPSASNPILRLMGKNLMVVNKDEDAPMPPGETQPVQLNSCPNPRFLNFSGVSHGNAQNPDYHYFHHMIPQGSFRYIPDSHNTVGQCSGIRLPNNFESHSIPKTPHALEGIFPNKHMGGAFAAPLGLHEYKGEHNLVAQQNTPTTRLGATSVYHMEKATRSPRPQYRNSSSMGNTIKEIIVIDDGPESEADSTTDDAKQNKCLRESQVPSADNLIPVPSPYNIRHLNPFSQYQLQDASPLGESPMLHSNSFLVPTSRRTNASPMKWSCTPESSGVMQRNLFMASSSSTGHLRSDFCYPPSLSKSGSFA